MEILLISTSFEGVGDESFETEELDNITNREIASQMRDGLRDLYLVLKGADAYIKFAFIALVNLFSLNPHRFL